MVSPVVLTGRMSRVRGVWGDGERIREGSGPGADLGRNIGARSRGIRAPEDPDPELDLDYHGFVLAPPCVWQARQVFRMSTPLSPCSVIAPEPTM